MAEVAATRSKVGPWDVFTWTGVTNADTFGSIRVEGVVTAATFYVSGTFGAATVVFQGSNDDSAFIGLADGGDTAISLTAAGGADLRAPWPYMRPSASGGTGQTLNATLAVMMGPA